jgi:hypothetical protein
MGAVLVPVVIVVVVVLVGLVLVKRLGRDGDQRREEVMGASHTLRYDVPEGQDAAAVLVALSRHGFEAVADPNDPHTLVIMCPLGIDQREEVRVVLENEAMQTLDERDAHVHTGPVRFVDER